MDIRLSGNENIPGNNCREIPELHAAPVSEPLILVRSYQNFVEDNKSNDHSNNSLFGKPFGSYLYQLGQIQLEQSHHFPAFIIAVTLVNSIYRATYRIISPQK